MSPTVSSSKNLINEFLESFGDLGIFFRQVVQVPILSSPAEEGTQGQQGGRQARACQAGRNAARRQQGFEDPGADRTPQGRDPDRDYDGHGHSVRGFLSTAAKKHGLKIESTKTEAGDRVYQIKK